MDKEQRRLWVLFSIERYGVLLNKDIIVKLLNKKKAIWVHQGYPKISIGGKTQLLSRRIMGFPKDLQVDHIDRNPLNNKRSNLRAVTCSQNIWNSNLAKTNTSGTRGVSFCKDTDLWAAGIIVNKRRYRKKFKSKRAAIKWRKEKECELYIY